MRLLMFKDCPTFFVTKRERWSQSNCKNVW